MMTRWCAILFLAWTAAGLAQPLQPATNAAPGALLMELSDVLGVLQAHHLPVDEAAARHAASEALLRSVDPAARLLTAYDSEHLQDERNGRDYHVGLTFTMSNGWPILTAIWSNAPAARLSLEPGARLVAVDGESARDRTLPAIMAVFRAHTNDTVHATFVQGGQTNEVELTRALLPLDPIALSEDLTVGLSYVAVNGFFAESGRTLAALIRGWSEMDRAGAIIDLRGADGRDLDSVVHVASLLADRGDVLFTLRDAQDQELEVYKAGESDPISMPIMALVDGDTRGAAEVLAAVLADSVRGAMLIGSTTRGDPEVREILDLASGDRVLMATRRLVTAQGRVFDGHEGVVPDIAVAPAAAVQEFEGDVGGGDRRAVLDEELADRALRERTRGDVPLRRAVDLLLGLKALNIHRDGLSSPAKSTATP